MAITATYTVTLSASDKDHARGEYVYASIVRTSPATLVPEGLYVQSATINMAGTTFWSGSGYNPYLDFGDIGRVFVSTSVTDKTAIPITTPTDFNLDELLLVGTVLNDFYIYGYKSSNGNVCTYSSNNAQFTITATRPVNVENKDIRILRGTRTIHVNNVVRVHKKIIPQFIPHMV